MKRPILVIVTAIALLSGLGAARPQASRPQEQLPPGHPPMPTAPDALPPGHPPMPTAPDALPSGHPPVTTAPAAAPTDPPVPQTARPADVRDPDAIVGAYYASISGPGGAPRDWARFQSLFLPGARLVSGTSGLGDGSPIVLTPDLYVRMNDKYFVSSGYTEQSVRERTDSYGQIAHVWSTYESLRGKENEPYSRGVNCFQLLHTDHRWWIVSVTWDRERPGVTPAP